MRAGADVMPRSQLEGQLVAELGKDWTNMLESFDWTPRAAASIGQVHAATLYDGTQVAMKIQYPGKRGGHRLYHLPPTVVTMGMRSGRQTC